MDKQIALLEDKRAGPAEDSRDLLSDYRNAGAANLARTTVLAIWLLCVAVGSVGLLVRYPRPTLAPRNVPVMAVERVNVELANDTISDVNPLAPTSDSPPPPAEALPSPPAAAPAPAPVAAPNPMIQLMVPVPGPTRQVEPSQAVPAPVVAKPPAPTHAQAPQRSVARPAAVRHLTFGVGEGRQPSPDYPRQAVIERQQGVVGIRFTVGDDGRVNSAQITRPSRWPLLNQAALQTIREHWRFNSGAVRSFDVSIEFQLNEQ